MKDKRLTKYKLKGYNIPKKTPLHKTKSHMVLAKKGSTIKLIRFGQQGAKTNVTESQRKRFFKRHKKNIDRGILYPAYWSNLIKWNPKKTKYKNR